MEGGSASHSSSCPSFSLELHWLGKPQALVLLLASAVNWEYSVISDTSSSQSGMATELEPAVIENNKLTDVNFPR